MEQSKKHRSVLRSAFTKKANELDQLISAEVKDMQQIQVSWEILQQKHDAIVVSDSEVYDALLTQDASEEDLELEMESSDMYRVRYTTLKFRINKLNQDDEVRSVRQSEQLSTRYDTGMRKFKLPTIEFKKFSGDIREWLSFWAQFRKIHEDPDIATTDKIEYLVQATVPCSRARQLVESYPAMNENYEKIIQSLKSRFGREDLQIEVYVRELLKLILNNAMSQTKSNLSTLYDKIETQLRALETLGITSEKCSAMLFPLIESCLPEDLLRVWQRSVEFSSGRKTNDLKDSDFEVSTLECRLKGLMRFLKNEIENEQRISLAAEGFGLRSNNISSNDRYKKDKLKHIETFSTAAGLTNCDVAKCVFCGGIHDSEGCFKAQKLSLDQKKNTLSEKKACFRCLKIGHLSRRCRIRLKCVICGKSHVTLMCADLPSNKITCVGQFSENKVKEGTTIENQVLANHNSAHVFLQTLRVTISCGDRSRKVRVLIDSGSQRSYVLKSTVSQMGYVPKRTELIMHCLFGGTQTSGQRHNCYDIKLTEEDYSCTFEALDQQKICNEIPSIFYGAWTEELKTLHIELHDTVGPAPIEVLIGADVAGKLYTGRRHILTCGLVAMETLLGWTLMGRIPSDLANCSTTLAVHSLFVKDATITNLWELDVLGIEEPCERKSREDLANEAKDFFRSTIKVDDEGRYEVRLPWLDGHPPLSDNYALAKKRLESTLKKLKNAQLIASYDQVFKEWIQEGIIEKVNENETGTPVHYLPHRPVIKESSLSTKIRPVFDASSHEKDKPALNHCLEKGLNLIELIPTILLRFRQQKIGVVSDIRKAFLQISVHEADRNFLRFLWIDHEGNEIIYRHRRVVFGVNSSPFLLGATIEYHISKFRSKCTGTHGLYAHDTIEKLARSFYVDNCVTSVPNETTLEKFIKEASLIMAEAKFDLRGWEHTETNTSNNMSLVLVLGLKWNKTTDTLTINKDCIESVNSIQDEVITKRFILSMAQRLFDPIGFTCPVSLGPKILLQQIWEKKLAWDVPVDGNIASEFCKWAKELPYLLEIEIPRWIHAGSEEADNWSLHTFCDASKKAYSSVIFLRVVHHDQIFVFLLAAKARIAPLKNISIPRLELMAATIGARLYSSIKGNFRKNIDCFFWSDSSTVISWIRRTEEWATFVWNRVAEIRTLTSIEAWRHVPGVLNPADLPSRGCSAKQLLESRWWEGPKWLYNEPCLWPREDMICNEEEIEKERKKMSITTLLNLSSDHWNLSRFSKYDKTLRTMAWIFRFIWNSRNENKRILGNLTVEEIDQAEVFIFKVVQHESFQNENEKKINSLNPFLDEAGLIRLRTPISRRNEVTDFCFPIVLPGKHPVVNRLIVKFHENSCHVGTQGLLSLLRQKYWILGGRRSIRSVISKCVICKRQTVKNLDVETPPLPIDRVRDATAFEVTGVDFAGPLFLKTGEKVWVCLFTCAVYRAVHLELSISLSTPNFIQTLRRFVARRGRPKTIYSDNGTNFIGTENAFNKLNWETITEYSSVQRIRWRFNPPTAAWWGGFWERLIGILKGLLRKVLGRASLCYEELLTLICECESIINTRPLTYISSDPEDLVALTPSMFLRDQTEYGMPDCDTVDRESLCRKIRHKQTLREHLRRRFRNEYLAQLKMAQKKNKSQKPVSVGDVVLIGNDTEKRMNWPLGRVVELIPGNDQRVRLVRMKTARGQLLRPLQRIYPLECVDSCKSDDGATLPSVKQMSDGRTNRTSSSTAPEEKSPTNSAGVSDTNIGVKSRVPDSKVFTRSGRESKLPIRFSMI